MVARETSLQEGLARMEVHPRRQDAIELLMAFGRILDEEAIPAGFLGPNEAVRLVGHHLLEACALLAWISPGAFVVDVGSGAGLPGLAVACVHDGRVILIESQRRRCEFVRQAAARLELEVEVEWARAEDAARGMLRDGADVVTGRAVAPAPVALELCLPFARLGGRVVIPMGDVREAPGDDDDREAGTRGELATVSGMLGGGQPSLHNLAVPGGRKGGSVMIVEKVDATPDRYPRRAGTPRRRPLP